VRANDSPRDDVTEALSLLCNSVESCSIPAGAVTARLGRDAYADPGVLDVAYRCNGEATDRKASFRSDQDIVLSCNVERAISGVYVNKAHDATAQGRSPEDTVVIAGAAGEADEPSLTFWSWTPSNAKTPSFRMSVEAAYGLNSLAYDAGTMNVQWGEEGHPLQIQTADGSTFTWFSGPPSASSQP
jgi:hypothetical protein